MIKKIVRNWLNYNNINFDVYQMEGVGQVLEIRKKDEKKVIDYLDKRKLMTAYKYDYNNVIITLAK